MQSLGTNTNTPPCLKRQECIRHLKIVSMLPAKQARKSACMCTAEPVSLQVYAKEEELVELQAKLGERDTALKAFKTENGRFADMKDKFKEDIASLQQQVLTGTCRIAMTTGHQLANQQTAVHTRANDKLSIVKLLLPLCIHSDGADCCCSWWRKKKRRPHF